MAHYKLTVCCWFDSGKNEMQTKLDFAMQDVNAKYQQLEELEKNSVRTALIEERGRFCLFISCIKPFVVRTRHSLPSSADLAYTFLSSSLRLSSPPHCQLLVNFKCNRIFRVVKLICCTEEEWSSEWAQVKMIMLWLELDKTLPLACEIVIDWSPRLKWSCFD